MSYDTRSLIATIVLDDICSNIDATAWFNRCITDSEAEEKLSIVMMGMKGGGQQLLRLPSKDEAHVSI